MSPDQLERRRASREAWRARNPYEWRRRRAPRGDQRPAAGLPDTLPDCRTAGPSGSDDLAMLRARVAALEAELTELRAYRQNDRERSRRNAARRRASGSPAVRQSGKRAGTSTTTTGTRTRSAGSRENDRASGKGAGTRHLVAGTPAARAGTPSAARATYSPVPPREYVSSREASTTTTTARPTAQTTGVVVVADPPVGEAVWDDAEVRRAVSCRPGIDVELLKGRVRDWLNRNPHCRLTVSLVLSFVERWRPGLDAAPPGRAYRSGSRPPGVVKVATPERMAAIEERQRRWLAGEIDSLASPGVV